MRLGAGGLAGAAWLPSLPWEFPFRDGGISYGYLRTSILHPGGESHFLKSSARYRTLSIMASASPTIFRIPHPLFLIHWNHWIRGEIFVFSTRPEQPYSGSACVE